LGGEAGEEEGRQSECAHGLMVARGGGRQELGVRS
jgi:hypothetical protein